MFSIYATRRRIARWLFINNVLHMSVFILTGSLSGISQLVVMEYYGTAPPSLGASGAGFALLGYLAVANPIGDYLSGKAIIGLVIIGASVLTIYLSASGSGILAHFSGAILGMIAGRFHLLNVE